MSSRLRFTTDEHGQEVCLVKVNEKEEVGVMMGWERGISEWWAFPVTQNPKPSTLV